MPKSVKIASVVVVALLLVVVVVMLSQQSPKPRNENSEAGGESSSTTTGKTPASKPAPYAPRTDITPERLPGTDSFDPNAPVVPHSPSGPMTIQSSGAETGMRESAPTHPTTNTSEPLESASPSSAPATAPAETKAAPIVIAKPTTAPAQPAPPAPATPPAPDPMRTYTVKAGDTLSSIAQRTLGSESRWHEIAEANPMVDPIKLRIGQVLNMPGVTDANGEKAATQPRDSSGRIIYIVRPLDSLASIAKQYYGTRELWKTIYSANRGSIGSNPDKLEPGTRLVIPPAPQPAR